jgi:hypothetical protein
MTRNQIISLGSPTLEPKPQFYQTNIDDFWLAQQGDRVFRPYAHSTATRAPCTSTWMSFSAITGVLSADYKREVGRLIKLLTVSSRGSELLMD